MICRKKVSKRLKSVKNDPYLCGNLTFDLLVAPEEKDGGGRQGPPLWQALSDVTSLGLRGPKGINTLQLPSHETNAWLVHLANLQLFKIL